MDADQQCLMCGVSRDNAKFSDCFNEAKRVGLILAELTSDHVWIPKMVTPGGYYGRR